MSFAGDAAVFEGLACFPGDDVSYAAYWLPDTDVYQQSGGAGAPWYTYDVRMLSLWNQESHEVHTASETCLCQCD